MLRNEIEKRLNITRKAIEYYEEKGLINPLRDDNSYRNYSDKDFERLKLINLYRKLDLNVDEIKNLIDGNSDAVFSIIRDREIKNDISNKKNIILNKLVNGGNINEIEEELNVLNNNESIYNKLLTAFPGYLGQCFFIAYRPFLNEKLDDDNKIYFDEFIKYLDSLDSLILSEEEKEFIEKNSSNYNIQVLDEINTNKINAINNIDTWLKENNDLIEEYEKFKNSEEYKNSLLNSINEKVRKFMVENNYYEIAIPLIRKFSKSYDEYYKKVELANLKYLEKQK